MKKHSLHLIFVFIFFYIFLSSFLGAISMHGGGINNFTGLWIIFLPGLFFMRPIGLVPVNYLADIGVNSVLILVTYDVVMSYILAFVINSICKKYKIL